VFNSFDIVTRNRNTVKFHSNYESSSAVTCARKIV